MIVFFPTYARRLPGQRRWHASIAGMVTRPLPERSRRRALARAVLKRILDVDDSLLDTAIFKERADAFFFKRIAGHPVRIAVGDTVVDAGQSDRAGHFSAEFILDDAAVESLSRPDAAGHGWLSYDAVPTRHLDDHGLGDPEPALPGRIQCIADEGLSVISDIDDTVKITDVARRRELLANTFLREFAAVPGMADVYRRLNEAGSVFHYVSASPWQLAKVLGDFFGVAGLPEGSMHLKLFRLKDSTPLGRLPSRKRSKKRAIERIMADFPGRRFILVGDSGERDPEVYTAVARRHPDRVVSVAIRHVDGKPSREKVRARLDRLASRLPSGTMQVFTDAAELDQGLSKAF
jgi:phosphatidate phosphatase APP1